MLAYLSMVITGGGGDTSSVSATNHLDLATGVMYTFGVVRAFRAVSCRNPYDTFKKEKKMKRNN